METVANDSLTFKVNVSNLRETMAAFRLLPKEANNELRDRTLKVSQVLAGKITGAARSSSKQSALVAGTVKAKRDRVPVVMAGGPKRVGSKRTPAHKILFGANFGAKTLRQYRPHRGAGDNDYWFFHTAEAAQPQMDREWNAAADAVIAKFSEGR